MAEEWPSGWRVEENRLRCTYKFADFVQAMAFLTEVAHAAERLEHHPDFCVHWNKVEFTVWSHDVDSITERDRKLVPEIAKIATRHGGKLPK